MDDRAWQSDDESWRGEPEDPRAARLTAAIDAFRKSMERQEEAMLATASAFKQMNNAIWRHLLDEEFGPT